MPQDGARPGPVGTVAAESPLPPDDVLEPLPRQSAAARAPTGLERCTHRGRIAVSGPIARAGKRSSIGNDEGRDVFASADSEAPSRLVTVNADALAASSRVVLTCSPDPQLAHGGERLLQLRPSTCSSGG
jgi:hypothetical protein